VGEWLKVYRIAHRADIHDAKRAEGGEPYGDPAFKKVAKKGEWLCRNPENGWLWTWSDESFVELYCEVGKVRPKKIKRQADGHKKGKSRHQSASAEVNDKAFGELFDEQEKKDGRGDRVVV